MTTLLAEPVRTRPIAPAKLRVLETASVLFTTDGIRSVGVDRLIAESKVTKATFYKHYGSKDRLVLDYIENEHQREVARTGERIHPEDVVRGIVTDALELLASEGFRGDAFLNAAAEYPTNSHRVRVLVREHREWLAGVLTQALEDLGHPLPGDAADDLISARDGALAGGFAGDAIAARASLERARDRVLAGTR